MSALASFHVPGRPRTKGSLKVITPRGRKPILIEDHAHSEPWRKRIKAAILAQCSPFETIAVPFAMRATFVFEQAGPSAQHLSWPVLNAGVNASGDLDKLLRNLLDAMQDSGLILDDCLVVQVITSKAWANEYRTPGVHVEVSAA